jgi:alpha-tubulin suppressor-like RCC1 family protein
MTTKISGSQITNFTIATEQLSNTTTASFASYAEFAGSLTPKITSIAIADASYNVLDDTAANTGGGYIVITGTNFVSGATILVDTTTASSVSFVNSTTIRAQVPAKAAASYNIWVINPDGGTAIKVNGLTYSTTPTWVTTSPLTGQTANVTFAIAFNATGAHTYSLAYGSTLPAGTTLAANGYFSGTVTTINTTTNYTFTIRATDTELQDADKSFTVTVTWVAPSATYVWGGNYHGYLGLNTGDSGAFGSTTVFSPTILPSTPNWSVMSWSENSAGGAIRTNGTLWTWGTDSQGITGRGTSYDGTNSAINYRSSPVQVGALTNWSNLHFATNSALATKTDGTLWTWGNNGSGRLGQNNSIALSSPVQVGTGTSWSKISGSGGLSAAIKTDGTLWTWGYGGFGALGQNNIIDRSSPVQVGALTNWSDIDSGNAQLAAIKTDGTLWLWGASGSYGVTGLNDRLTYRSSPVQVGSGTTWNSVVIGDSSLLATKTDGTLWAWGKNDKGQLGQNNTITRSSPVQVGTDTNWSIQITTGYKASGAIRSNGTLWTWGQNDAYSGGLGFRQIDSAYKSSPVQVGALTNWSITGSPRQKIGKATGAGLWFVMT